MFGGRRIDRSLTIFGLVWGSGAVVGFVLVLLSGAGVESLAFLGAALFWFGWAWFFSREARARARRQRQYR